MARSRVIFDTDPGVDDTLAMLLALASSAEEIELVLISVTYGNVKLRQCLKNVIAMFHVLDKEMEWRKATGKPLGYESLRTYKPIVAIGAEHALEEETLREDGFHGTDGLHGVHEAHPHLDPGDIWDSLFDESSDGQSQGPEDVLQSPYFTPSKLPSQKAILKILREEPADTITICAVGPMTNLALAAAEDPETFLRAKEICVMGGAVEVPGNITPLAEFNTYADALSTARVFALTSPTPSSTMPVVPQTLANLGAYPETLSRRLNLSLFPLDITNPHLLMKGFFFETVTPHAEQGSPLAAWVSHFLGAVYRRMERFIPAGREAGLPLHDPVTIWYSISHGDSGWKLAPNAPEDIRVETSGQWTHGMHILDGRGRRRAEGAPTDGQPADFWAVDDLTGDDFGWLSTKRGNRINRFVESPGHDKFGPELMQRLFG